MFPPALPPPLDTRHQGEQDGRQTSRPVVVDQVSAVESDQSSSEHDQPPEQGDVRVVLVGEPLGQQAPADSKRQTYQNLYRSVESELQSVGVLVEGDSKEDSKPADGHHVVRGAGGDDQGGNTFSNTVTSEKGKGWFSLKAF